MNSSLEQSFEQIKNMNLIFDTHAHYNDPKFSENQFEILNYVHQNGVSNVCNMSASLEECATSVELAKKFDFVFCAVGIHPENVDSLNENWQAELESFAKQEKVVAIGEIGLDYHSENFNKNKQIEVFEQQMEIAQKLDLPVAIHSREAAFDTITVLKKFSSVKGVVHCFSGSVETAEQLLDLGYFLGFTGILTFKNSKQVKQVARAVGLSRMVIETDCPFLAPEPWRGQVCNSSMLVSVVKTLAEIKEVSFEEVVKVTNKNAFELYRIK